MSTAVIILLIIIAILVLGPLVFWGFVADKASHALEAPMHIKLAPLTLHGGLPPDSGSDNILAAAQSQTGNSGVKSILTRMGVKAASAEDIVKTRASIRKKYPCDCNIRL